MLVTPGMADVLATLHKAGATMAVRTAKREDFAERIFAMCGLLDRFRFVDGGHVRVEKPQQGAGLRARKAVAVATVRISGLAVDMIAGQLK